MGYQAGDQIDFAAGAIYSSGGGSPTFSFKFAASAFDSSTLGEVRTLAFQAAYNGAFANTKTKGTVTPNALLDGTVRDMKLTQYKDLRC